MIWNLRNIAQFSSTYATVSLITEHKKNLMKESLQTDMEDILKRLELTVPENSSTQTSQSEFDITSMLGEWTLEVAQPNTENVSRHLIRLNADGTMTLRAEDGSWLDYTYTMDENTFLLHLFGNRYHRRRNVCDLRGQDHPFQRELEKDLGFLAAHMLCR